MYDYYRREPVDLGALRRAANANLRKITDGTHKREAEEQRLRAQRQREYEQTRKRELREERAALKAELTTKRRELKTLQKEWNWLYELDDLSGTKSDMGVEDHVVLEEVDSMICPLQERIVEIEDRLFHLKEELW